MAGRMEVARHVPELFELLVTKRIDYLSMSYCSFLLQRLSD